MNKMFESTQVLDTNVSEEETGEVTPTLTVKQIRAILTNKGVQAWTVLNFGDQAYPVRMVKKDLSTILTGLPRKKKIPGALDSEGNLWLLGVDFLISDE